MKIGIFGGSFNPPHNMHKNIALELLEKNYLDKIIYIPTGDNYKKKDLINFYDRYNMVKLMIKDNDKLLISDIGNNDDYKYTYQVLDYFKENNNDIYFICGSDNLTDFINWMNYEYILKNYKLLVIKRNNDNIEEILKIYENYKTNIILANIESKVLSSSFIRDNIKNDVKDYLDNDVYEYIKKKSLYKR